MLQKNLRLGLGLGLALVFGCTVVACDNSDDKTTDTTSTTAPSGATVTTDTAQTSSATAETTTPDGSGTSSAPGAKLVEIRLIDAVDEARGYCLDVSGGKGEGAAVEKGLQAHTCYDYTGSLLVDQSFDAALVASSGEFKIPHFNVCMTASGTQVGASLQLTACEGKDTQLFTLKPDGQIVLQSNDTLCVTVSSTEKKEGKGGDPKHVMRPVSLQACSAENAIYQKWKTFSL